jgi:hypothetical protein
MLSMNRDAVIDSIEEFYCDRLNELVDQERFDDSNAIFEEFVVDSHEPTQWFFLNVC